MGGDVDVYIETPPPSGGLRIRSGSGVPCRGDHGGSAASSGPATPPSELLDPEPPIDWFADPPGPFAAPWEAQAFAMALALHRAGLFTWKEWSTTLANCIREAQATGDPDLGNTYYRHWLTALEQLVAAKGAGSGDELERVQLAWARAARRTPHGQPVELLPDDLLAGATPEVR